MGQPGLRVYGLVWPLRLYYHYLGFGGRFLSFKHFEIKEIWVPQVTVSLDLLKGLGSRVISSIQQSAALTQISREMSRV